MEEEKTGEIEIPSSDSSLFVQEAESLRLQKKYDEAIHVCREGLKKTPEALSGRLILGRCYLESHRIPEARKELEKVAPDCRGMPFCLQGPRPSLFGGEERR